MGPGGPQGRSPVFPVAAKPGSGLLEASGKIREDPSKSAGGARRDPGLPPGRGDPWACGEPGSRGLLWSLTCSRSITGEIARNSDSQVPPWTLGSGLWAWGLATRVPKSSRWFRWPLRSEPCWLRT